MASILLLLALAAGVALPRKGGSPGALVAGTEQPAGVGEGWGSVEPGMPEVVAAAPARAVIVPLGRLGAHLVGHGLAGVTSVDVVTAGGTSVHDLETRLLPASDSRNLVLELRAGADVEPGFYRLQINSIRGGLYLPQEVMIVHVLE
ncbi:MAG: hypothetical protein R3325_15510 [Thermoanaerobaculia bacterium]|nr:hypothetical protein [Thermoanaerobaculia bacterium]